MEQNQPLVSIGIPTYNRSALLKRSIESALNQDYKNIEVVISDNGSTDETECVCYDYCSKDPRIKYIKQTVNRGPAANFSAVLETASGHFFMWLGDDDWIDSSYVTSCVQQFSCDSTMSLVSGTPNYYRDGQKLFAGKRFNLLHDAWWVRVILYYWQVADNGMFYGLMKMSQIKQIEMPNKMGGDWLLIANIVSMGKTKTVPTISVHRELGGATASYSQIAAVLKISRIHAVFPMLSAAINAWMDIVVRGKAYKQYLLVARLPVACTVFLGILWKSNMFIFRITKKLFNLFIQASTK